MSSNMGWRVGISGPFWYASGATVQILLFSVLSIQVKRRAPHMRTFMEVVKARFGTTTHCVMICFALLTNCIVTSMLLLGGASTISDLTGMSKIWAAFLIPLLSCWIYAMHGGLRATFFTSYVHTTIIFLMLIIFGFTVYGGSGDSSGLYGSPSKVYNGLEKASIQGFFSATQPEQTFGAGGYFSSLGSYILNDGTCYSSGATALAKSCSFKKLAKDEWCCSSDVAVKGDGHYCRASTKDCIDVSETEHFGSSGCDFGAGGALRHFLPNRGQPIRTVVRHHRHCREFRHGFCGPVILAECRGCQAQVGSEGFPDRRPGLVRCALLHGHYHRPCGSCPDYAPRARASLHLRSRLWCWPNASQGPVEGHGFLRRFHLAAAAFHGHHIYGQRRDHRRFLHPDL
ncbi:unnamed protein product [Polarella glacialis]|uniref:Uncharacterized protein n=1 Tax=Polarella glacialis TaxID=89957 RepID=A0A813IJV3_POLGL|nr:unnamed protein product [Polarella glacialis]